ncbi:hypothetical protein AVEN_60622-1 [Araneus ventricosus]|uniref:Uncharacterized protein n=1 Tax=Araneus ventricosus TaxID=182803 RepID=A0A4Y1ZU22_ARAVE|nr:hypothetical protein AVEN_60622-1 [Araneus ventricosus]
MKDFYVRIVNKTQEEATLFVRFEEPGDASLCGATPRKIDRRIYYSKRMPGSTVVNSTGLSMRSEMETEKKIRSGEHELSYINEWLLKHDSNKRRSQGGFGVRSVFRDRKISYSKANSNEYPQ